MGTITMASEVSLKLDLFNVVKLEKEFTIACNLRNYSDAKTIVEKLGFQKTLNPFKKIKNWFKVNYNQKFIRKDILDKLLIRSCQAGNLETAKYLISSNELSEHPTIKAQSESCFRWASGSENLELIRYLLESEDLKKNPSVHYGKDFLFRYACHCDNKELLSFLIFDYKIIKTEMIEDFLEEKSFPVAKQMFELRELNGSLNNNLFKNPEVKKKIIKI